MGRHSFLTRWSVAQLVERLQNELDSALSSVKKLPDNHSPSSPSPNIVRRVALGKVVVIRQLQPSVIL